jgi:O-antigen/teichoic acid export membrane protein
MVPILVISIALRDPLIRIFYSPAFAGAAPLIPVQVFGDYLRVVGWSFAVVLFAIGHPRSHLAVIASQAVVWVAMAALLVPMWGLNAVPLTYAISFLTYPVLGFALVRRWTGVSPDRRGLLLIALGFICVIGAAAPLYLGTLLVPVMPLVVYLLNRHELKAA